MVNWTISGRKRSSPGSRYYHNICGQRNETDKSLSQDSLQPDRHTHRKPNTGNAAFCHYTLSPNGRGCNDDVV
jgi:hypothetical protein